MRLREEWNWTAADGLRLYARGWRPDDGSAPTAAVLIVHGMGEHIGRYEYVAESLAAAGCACVGYDLRGHGRSDGQRGHTRSYRALLDDMELALAKLREYAPGVPVFVWAHSYGGGIALNYAIRRQPQLDGMIITGPWLRLAFDPPGWKLALGRVMRLLRPSFTLKRGISSGRLTPVSQAEKEAGAADTLNHGVISATSFFGARSGGRRVLRQADRLRMPILLMHGGDDRVTDASASRELADRLGTRCTFKLWDGMVHELHHDFCKEQMMREAVQWMEQSLQGTAATR